MMSNLYALVSFSVPFALNHYYSPGPHISGIRDISHGQVREMQLSSLPLQVTGTYFHGHGLTDEL
jgi:hypothetical protein